MPDKQLHYVGFRIGMKLNPDEDDMRVENDGGVQIVFTCMHGEGDQESQWPDCIGHRMWFGTKLRSPWLFLKSYGPLEEDPQHLRDALVYFERHEDRSPTWRYLTAEEIFSLSVTGAY